MPGLDKLMPVCQHISSLFLPLYDSSGLWLRGTRLRGVLMKRSLLISHGSAHDAAWSPCLASVSEGIAS